MMLDRGRDDVPPVAAPRRQPENRQVVAFRRAAREDHVAAACCRRPRPRGRARCSTAVRARRPQLVRAAAGVAEVLVQVAQHLGADPGIQRRRRGAIEIDRHCRNHHAPERRRRPVSIADAQLARDWALFQAVEAGRSRTALPMLGDDPARRRRRTEQPDRRRRDRGRVPRRTACRVLRRFSGGGAVVLGSRLSELRRRAVACFVAGAGGRRRQLSVHPGTNRRSAWLSRACSVAGQTDLALNGRKVSGNAQRRGRRALIHHGTLLYGFDPTLATRFLKEPARQPAYRAARRHADFIGNLPLSAETIQTRLEAAWRAFGDERVGE